MTVFVDTSALYAVLDRDDAGHAAARGAWRSLLSGQDILVTHNYVLVETSALVQHRLGLAALRALCEDVVPLLRLEWIDPERHRTAVEMALTAGRRKLSLVDCASFALMREIGIGEAFCFDAHFREAGFKAIP